MQEGVYELHWQRREYGEVQLQLYAREDGGQLKLVNTFDQGPFDGASDVASWLTRQLVVDTVLPRR